MFVGAIFLLGGIQWHTFASSALPYQVPFYQTALLLLYVAQQKKKSKGTLVGRFILYYMPPTSAFDIMKPT